MKNRITKHWRAILSKVPGYDPFTSAGDAWFDADTAEKAIGFIHECVKHVEGAMAGQPFILEEWQQAIVANLLGWKRIDEQGRTVRRYRECFLYVPRKNGKTPLAAAIGLAVFFADDEAGQQNYIAAADREQAGMLFRQVKGMVEREPEMESRCRMYGGNASAGQSRSLVRETDGSFMRVISADADSKHGGNSHLVLIDELHAQPNRDLVDVLTTSMASANRKQPILMLITTADFARPSICNEKHDYACKVRDGVIDDPSFLPVIYEASEEDDWQSEHTWRRANPNIGVSVSLDYLRRESKRAQETPAYENTFKRLHLNIKTQNDVRWMPDSKWMTCTQAEDPVAWRTEAMERMQGQRCFGGLDLSTVQDLTALVLWFPQVGGDILLPFFWLPSDNMEQRYRQDRVPYPTWVRQGFIKTTPGNRVDYDFIRKDINDLAKQFCIVTICRDRWNAEQITNQLIGDGIDMAEFGQGYASMSNPTKELEKKILGREFDHGGNPVLRWNVANAAAEQDAAGNIKLSKKKSTERIDGAVATVMALGAMIEAPDQEPALVMLG